MKKLIPILFILTLTIGCKDKCQDNFCPEGMTCVDGKCVGADGSGCQDSYCPAGMVCVDGQCKTADGSCPDGYEGDNCDIASNKKFAGTYDVDYTGSGGLSGSDGNTTANVTEVNGTADKIRIEVALDVNASVMGQSITLPLDVSVVADVDGDTYSVPQTSINTSVTIPNVPFPVPINIDFKVDGQMVSETQLNSTLTMSGSLAGTIQMTGTK